MRAVAVAAAAAAEDDARGDAAGDGGHGRVGAGAADVRTAGARDSWPNLDFPPCSERWSARSARSARSSRSAGSGSDSEENLRWLVADGDSLWFQRRGSDSRARGDGGDGGGDD